MAGESVSQAWPQSTAKGKKMKQMNQRNVKCQRSQKTKQIHGRKKRERENNVRCPERCSSISGLSKPIGFGGLHLRDLLKWQGQKVASRGANYGQSCWEERGRVAAPRGTTVEGRFVYLSLQKTELSL